MQNLPISHIKSTEAPCMEFDPAFMLDLTQNGDSRSFASIMNRGEFKNKALVLSPVYDWSLVQDSAGRALAVPTKPNTRDAKKQYTIIYGVWFTVGSHRQSTTHCDWVETDNITEFIKQEKYNGNIWFVFDGWCQYSIN